MTCPAEARAGEDHRGIVELRNKQLSWRALLMAVLLCGYAAAASEIPPGRLAPGAPVLEANPTNVAKLLAAADTWLLPQPKAVAMSGEGFDLKQCREIRLLGCDYPRLKTDFPLLLQERCGIRLKASIGKPGRGWISLVLCPNETPPAGVK